MPSIDYAAVRSTIPMLRVLELIPYEPTTRRGSQLRGRCPLNTACSAPSFSINLDRNLYHCFGCGVGGNQLDLWSAIYNSPLHEAAANLCHQAGIAVPYLNQSDAIHNA